MQRQHSWKTPNAAHRSQSCSTRTKCTAKAPDTKSQNVPAKPAVAKPKAQSQGQPLQRHLMLLPVLTNLQMPIQSQSPNQKQPTPPTPPTLHCNPHLPKKNSSQCRSLIRGLRKCHQSKGSNWRPISLPRHSPSYSPAPLSSQKYSNTEETATSQITNQGRTTHSCWPASKGRA